MCGICGHFKIQRDIDVLLMLDAMRHRGPDDSGIYKDENVTFGMVRLAIIDTTATGHQPMCNEQKNVWIVYNGETYNFKSEREILLKKGYKFHSNSDTEVVLKMYMEYGHTFLQRMRGMFALAIYDKRGNNPKVLVARDQFGIKPLLYTQIDNGLLFASELKSLFASRLIKKQIDHESLRLLLTYGSIPQPRTIISNVKMLQPGYRLIIENNKVDLQPYWKFGLNHYNGLRSKSYNEQLDILEGELRQSVKLQLISDVPIGAFLSGGIDSSLLVAIMSQLSSTKVKTFSVGFEQEGKHIDETDDAYKIAKYIGTDHTNVIITGNDLRKHIFNIVKALDQPSVDGVNSYFVSMAAKQAVTVAISGTGGDELFAGYPWFRNMKKFENESDLSLKQNSKRLIGKILHNKYFNKYIPGKYDSFIENYRCNADFKSFYARQYQIFGTIDTSKIINPEIANSMIIGNEMSHDIYHHDELSHGSAIERVTALCLQGYTSNQLLRDIDATSASHSLEVRVPFLDQKLIDLVLSLPDETKISNNINYSYSANPTYRESGTKKILLDIGKKLLPKNFDNQPKRGFGMPFDFWMKNSIADIVEDTLSENSIKNRGLFNFQEVELLNEKFKLGEVDWPKPWLIMMIELWCREMID